MPNDRVGSTVRQKNFDRKILADPKKFKDFRTIKRGGKEIVIGIKPDGKSEAEAVLTPRTKAGRESANSPSKSSKSTKKSVSKSKTASKKSSPKSAKSPGNRTSAAAKAAKNKRKAVSKERTVERKNKRKAKTANRTKTAKRGR